MIPGMVAGECQSGAPTANHRAAAASEGAADGRAGHVEHDLAGRAAAVDQLERVGGLLEREPRADHRPDGALPAISRRSPPPISWLSFGLRHHVVAPAGADHLGVVQQQPVDPDLGDRPAGEPDHDHAAALAQRAQAVGEPVAADRVDHDVDPASGDLLRLVLPGAVAADDVVSAGLPRHALLVVGGDDRDRRARRGPSRSGGSRCRRRRRRRARARSRPRPPAAGHKREVRGVVVEDQARALGEVELVGELEGKERRRDRDLGPPALACRTRRRGRRPSRSRPPARIGRLRPPRCPA